MRENAATKAARLLVTGAVRVLYAHGREIRVLVQGDHGSYVVEHQDGQLRCPCPSWSFDCSHRIAAGLVTVAPSGTWVVTPELQLAIGGER